MEERAGCTIETATSCDEYGFYMLLRWYCGVTYCGSEGIGILELIETFNPYSPDWIRSYYALSDEELAEVRIEARWRHPGDSPAKPVTVTEAERTRMYEDSPHTQIDVDPDRAAEVHGVINDRMFQTQARLIWQASSAADRELGVLSVYARGDDYYVYSSGTPNPRVANRINQDPKNPSYGRHVFYWHPHPGRNPEQSHPDLQLSYDRGSPGAIQYGPRINQVTIYQGGCKPGRTC